MAVTRPPEYVPVDPNDVDTDVVISQSTVNVGQFGWTTNDMTGVKDIIRYVATAQAAAESADANAKYVQSQMDKLDSSVATVQGIASTVADSEQRVISIQHEVEKTVADMSNLKDAAQQSAQQSADLANRKAQEASESAQVVKTYALAALYSYGDNGIIEDDETQIAPADGTIQRLRLSKPTTDIELMPFPTDPDKTARQLTLIVEQGTGSNLITFKPKTDAQGQYNVVHWNNNRPPRLSYLMDKADIITLLTKDKGRTWFGFYNGGWFNI